MKITRITTHDRLGFRVKAADGKGINLNCSRSRTSISGSGINETQMRAAFAWFERITNDKKFATVGKAFDHIEAFLNACQTLDEVIAGPNTTKAMPAELKARVAKIAEFEKGINKAAVAATVKRMAAEVIAKTAPATSGKYDHLYTAGMTAKQKQAIRARARREA